MSAVSVNSIGGMQHPTPLAKKRSFRSLAAVCFALLMGNVEYSVVMPSLLLYLRTLDPETPTVFFGVCLGAFNASQMIFSPLFGYWLDKRPMKEVITFCVAIGIVGNTVYSLAPSIYVVLLGRIISGAGGNIYNTVMLYVIRVSDEDERSSLYAKVNLVYFMGMLSGPALNYPLSLLGHYNFGFFNVTPLNSPGLLMVLLLVVSTTLLLVFFEEPLKMDEVEEELTPQERKCFGMGKYKPLFTSFTLFSIIVIQFIIQFNQITLETIITPETSKLYGFGQLENSIVYAAITVLFFVFFILISVIGKRVQDRTLLLIGTVVTLVSFGFAVGWLWSRAPTYRLVFWAFCVMVAGTVSGIPFYMSSLGSMFSKVVGDKKIQGMGQSMLAAATSLASIIGPFVSSAVLPVGGIRVIFLMLLSLIFAVVVLIVLRFKQLDTSNAPAVLETIQENERVFDKGSGAGAGMSNSLSYKSYKALNEEVERYRETLPLLDTTVG